MMNRLILVAVGAFLTLGVVRADIIHNDDVLTMFSHCVGQDCVNGESFGFDTVRLKENNLRIHFLDTSNSASFPTNDWRITINDSANGGASYFAVDDATAGNHVFQVFAGTGANSLVVKSGKVGMGTASPVVELHVKDGDTPTVRLEQDGSSGFTPQTWDVAGNETNFFIRDATNGSTLPFRIRPGAPSSSLDIAADGDVGIGTASPDAGLHVLDTVNNMPLHVEGAGDVFINLESNNNGAIQFRLQSDSNNRRIVAIDSNGIPKSQLVLGDEQVRILGPAGTDEYAKFDSTGISVNMTAMTVPDYVFEETYKLMPLDHLKKYVSENKHLPEIPTAVELSETGINMTEMQMLLLKKVEELTLYTLAQQEVIDELQSKLSILDSGN